MWNQSNKSQQSLGRLSTLQTALHRSVIIMGCKNSLLSGKDINGCREMWTDKICFSLNCEFVLFYHNKAVEESRPMSLWNCWPSLWLFYILKRKKKLNNNTVHFQFSSERVVPTQDPSKNRDGIFKYENYISYIKNCFLLTKEWPYNIETLINIK